MMGHISDRTLDNLLDGSIDDAGELAIEEHVRRCDRCAHRLREWELLFPQIKSLIPTGEHPAMGGEAAVAAPHAPSVYIPDWTPPRSPHAIPTRLAWGLVVVLGLGAGYLIFQRVRNESSSDFGADTYELATESATGDSAGLGSGIPTTPDLRTAAVETTLQQRDTTIAPARESVPTAPGGALEQEERRPETPPPPVARPEPVREPVREPAREQVRESAEQDVRVPVQRRETPTSFPIRVDTLKTETPQRPAPEEPASPLPTHFQRVTLGEAINRLSGTVRLIQGLNPEAVEIAQGSALPGADPGIAVVRVVYNAPEGRLILDQQRLGRAGSREPSIAISTAPNGVSVAQWVDRGGFWISLAGRADQQTLLAIANRVR